MSMSMRTLSFLIGSTLTIGCGSGKLEKPPSASPDEEEVLVDLDVDGFSSEDGDCNDYDADVYPGAPDPYGDGADQNCDGTDGVDEDGDGWASAAGGGPDCDDTDAALGDIGADADCDGVQTDNDCNDTDPSMGAVSEDADCDGVQTDNDCNDTDPFMGAVSEDADCDGARTEDDCDDGDPETGAIAQDADCDGVPTDLDCDDNSALLGDIGLDGDCDGVLATDDCNDGDPSQPLNDADCDGVLTSDDCDDSDPSLPPVDDPDCDGNLSHPAGGTLIRIAATTFDMGCTSEQTDCDDDELPVTTVTLTQDFYIGETEVTQQEYQSVMSANPSDYLSCGLACPVEAVGWHMAAAYTNQLSISAGLTECYSCTGTGSSVTCGSAMSPYACDGYRLPTEAEWEAAARCGDSHVYSGSDIVEDVGWFNTNASSTPHRVTDKLPNSCGLYDMSGNIWEWVHDWYDEDYYDSAGRTDPEGPPTGYYKVKRGGAWCVSPAYLRNSGRHIATPSTSFAHGFRVARTAP